MEVRGSPSPRILSRPVRSIRFPKESHETRCTQPGVFHPHRDSRHCERRGADRIRPEGQGREAEDVLRSVRGARVPDDRALPRRPRHGGHGSAPRSAHVLLRRDRRRRLEDDRRRFELGGPLRQGLPDRLDRRDRRRGVGSERRLRGHRRRADPRQRVARRRRVQVDRRGPHLEKRGTQGHAPDRARARPSEEPRSRLRRGAGAHLGPQRRAGHLPFRGRREDVEEDPLRRRQDGRLGPRDGPLQPAHPLRRVLAGRPPSVGARLGRPGQQPLEVDRRRRLLEEADGGPSGGAVGESGRGGLAGAARPRVRVRRGEARRPLPQRERRREVHARQRRAQDPRARLVLLVDLPGPEERRPPLPAERPDAQIDRRRQDLREHARAARRQPRHVDRPRRRIALHRRQRRRRDDHVQRRQELVDAEQPADRPVLPRHDRQPVSLLGLRLAAGQLERRDPERRRGGVDRTFRLAFGRRRRERLDGRRPGRPQHRLRRRVRRDHHALRPPHEAGPRRHGLAAAGRRARDERPQVPVPVERPDHDLAERPQGGLPRLADPSAQPRRRRDVGGDLAGPDAQRQGRSRASPAGRSRPTSRASSSTRRSSRSASRRRTRA